MKVEDPNPPKKIRRSFIFWLPMNGMGREKKKQPNLIIKGKLGNKFGDVLGCPAGT